ncbi:hypothetical protein C7444_109155 [Sphaerotilus hippei]|uniref:Uncharacterized protein n=1 Tax=Sphaerotilus hippei TaxID=744406 RepID=A0A318HAH8_9BURK|nr:hypothetical protein [Sphaerotilus hippei]PXW95585.1 hypothetical protein C7444_109155 [Sphaerotilus hippei]
MPAPIETPGRGRGRSVAALLCLLTMLSGPLLPIARAQGQAAAAGGPPASDGARDFSEAERRLLMSDQLATLQPPTTLRYGFRRASSIEEAYADRVELQLSRRADGSCCDTRGQFLTGARAQVLPLIEGAQGNPITLHFLERDLREMKRLTQGSTQHFRKQIRMAIYRGATVRPLTLSYRGQPVAGQEILISPYLDDPNRPRFEKYAGKQYRFWLSDAVPGGVYAIHTLIPDPASALPLIEEELLIDGGVLPALARPPTARNPP